MLLCGRMENSHLKDHIPFLLKSAVLIEIRGSQLFFFYLIIFLPFGAVGPCPLTFLAFGVLSVRTSLAPF